GDEPLVVPAALLLERLREAFLRLLVLVGQLGEVADRRVASAGARRFVVTDTHDSIHSRSVPIHSRSSRRADLINKNQYDNRRARPRSPSSSSASARPSVGSA